jgi:TPR repeat protein
MHYAHPRLHIYLFFVCVPHHPVRGCVCYSHSYIYSCVLSIYTHTKHSAYETGLSFEFCADESAMKEAYKYYKIAAEGKEGEYKHDAEVKMALAYMHGMNVVPIDFTKAVGVLETAYAAGNKAAGAWLAYCVAEGLGTKQDLARSATLVQDTPDEPLSVLTACSEGVRSRDDDTVANAEAKLTELGAKLQILANVGHAWAQCILAGMFNDGLLPPPNEDEAQHLSKAAAFQGHAYAQYSLGLHEDDKQVCV